MVTLKSCFFKKTLNNSLILSSSCSVYEYGEEKIFREENILKPNNFYAISKFMQEKILQVYCNKKNIDFLCYRLGYVFGKGMNKNRLVKKIVKSIKKNYLKQKKIRKIQKQLKRKLII